MQETLSTNPLNLLQGRKVIFEKRVYDFPISITESKKRRKKYYKKGQKIPKKYKTDEFSFNTEGFLVNSNKEKIIANPRVAGTPKIVKISGQDIWKGISYYRRSQISKELKRFFYENICKFIRPLEITDYPIGIMMVFFDIVDSEDLNNQEYFYKKTLGDALAGNVEFKKERNGSKTVYTPDYKKYPKIIQDDSKEFVQEYITSFIPITSDEKRSLLIKIYKL